MEHHSWSDTTGVARVKVTLVKDNGVIVPRCKAKMRWQ